MKKIIIKSQDFEQIELTLEDEDEKDMFWHRDIHRFESLTFPLQNQFIWLNTDKIISIEVEEKIKKWRKIIKNLLIFSGLSLLAFSLGTFIALFIKLNEWLK